jgi:hypothetical protein
MAFHLLVASSRRFLAAITGAIAKELDFSPRHDSYTR